MMRTKLHLGLIFALLFSGVSTRAAVVTNDFSNDILPWTPLFTGGWTNQADNGNSVAALIQAGTQRPPVRRPTAYLFLPGQVWSNLTFTVRAKSLEPSSLKQRDVCLIFGYVDDTHYYYAHIASTTDNTFHNIIMKVTGSTRQVIQLENLPPVRLTDGWHTIQIRHQATGAISVFVDDLLAPLMTANDAAYPVGAVAFGSFDDRALFDDVRVEGESVAPVAPVLQWDLTSENLLPLRYFASRGFRCQLQSASAGSPWEFLGASVAGGNAFITNHVSILAGAPRFFRVQVAFPELAAPDVN